MILKKHPVEYNVQLFIWLLNLLPTTLIARALLLFGIKGDIMNCLQCPMATTLNLVFGNKHYNFSVSPTRVTVLSKHSHRKNPFHMGGITLGDNLTSFVLGFDSQKYPELMNNMFCVVCDKDITYDIKKNKAKNYDDSKFACNPPCYDAYYPWEHVSQITKSSSPWYTD